MIVDAPTRSAGSHVSRERLLELGRSALRFTTRAERLRIWRLFKEKAERPPTLRELFEREGDSFAVSVSLVEGASRWNGLRIARSMWNLRWSKASSIVPSTETWQKLLPTLRDDTGHVMKRDRSGSVIAKTIEVDGQTLELIVKRPTFKPGFKGWLQRRRTSRVRQVWKRATRLLSRGIDCEWPTLVLDRHERGALADQLIVFERVPGTVLSELDLAGLGSKRDLLMRRLGSVLRTIESLGWSHFDTKTTNWIITTDCFGDPQPILIDVIGVRFYPWRGFSLKRLIRALKTHPQFTEIDERALRCGYER
ncbi:MAG: hypothetical protein QM770_09575 [Tepidisphaeraceae bacterium]